MPLFAGGGTNSRVREAVYLHRASREALQRVTERTERQARDAYLGCAVGNQPRAGAETGRVHQAARHLRRRKPATKLARERLSKCSIRNSHCTRHYELLPEPLRLHHERTAIKQAAGTLQVQDLEQIDQWLKNRPAPEQRLAEEESEAN